MPSNLVFSINRISVSTMPFRAFAAMAQRLGVRHIEIRNDLAGVETEDGTGAGEIGAIATGHGLTIRSINALQRFDQFDAEREAEADALARYAAQCGALSLVLCPTNSRQDQRSEARRHDDLVSALTRLAPLLAGHGITGLLEPLGFEECAMRRKSLAVVAKCPSGYVCATTGQQFRIACTPPNDDGPTFAQVLQEGVAGSLHRVARLPVEFIRVYPGVLD